ncbi:hypothetical protein NBRC116583_38800 [Arenicella sp. 4NH20-0111]|uniref:hypothetical protein n=1 Tax=Arenicella sp. 4NH20-0111 TaxID=3127648 RepID=UPI00310A7FE5
MNVMVGVILAAVGLLHTLPVLGSLGVAYLHKLYGIDIDDPQIELLLRHRAVLFGVLGVTLMMLSIEAKYHTVGLLIGFVSTVSFVALSVVQQSVTSSISPQISRVITIDIICSVVLFTLLSWTLWVKFREIV